MTEAPSGEASRGSRPQGSLPKAVPKKQKGKQLTSIVVMLTEALRLQELKGLNASAVACYKEVATEVTDVS